MGNDIIEIKPGIGPFKFNLVELWRRIKNNPSPVEIVAQRFIHAFKSHGVAVTQIRHFIPEITLDRLSSSAALLPVLSNAVLDKTAELFGIRREWLEGVDDCIYPFHGCYNHPEQFFEDLATVKREEFCYHARVIVGDSRLDYRSERQQLIALLFVEKIGELGDEDIYRCKIYGDEWKWNYTKARIQLKAMVRVYEKLVGPIPMHLIEADAVPSLCARKLIPCVRGSPVTNPSLEDFVLSPSESMQSKESEELPYVFDYIAAHNLEKVAEEKLRNWISTGPEKA